MLHSAIDLLLVNFFNSPECSSLLVGLNLFHVYRSSIQGSVVSANAHISEKCELKDCIVGSGQSIAANSKYGEPFLFVVFVACLSPEKIIGYCLTLGVVVVCVVIT